MQWYVETVMSVNAHLKIRDQCHKQCSKDENIHNLAHAEIDRITFLLRLSTK